MCLELCLKFLFLNFQAANKELIRQRLEDEHNIG